MYIPVARGRCVKCEHAPTLVRMVFAALYEYTCAQASNGGGGRAFLLTMSIVNMLIC